MSQATPGLLQRLQAIVGEAGMLAGDAVRERSDDWPPRGGCQAIAIVRPASTEEVAAVLRVCHAAGQPVVTHGGLTGLVKACRAGAGELVLSLERMRQVEAVDAVSRTMTVQAGVTLQAAHEAAEKAGLMFPLDLGARGSCTIGGNISTNAGGNSVIRYGMTREQVLGLEAVLADGTVVSSLNRVIKNNTGYDLKQLFIGSEGTLGIVTRAVLRLRPRPRGRQTALLAVPDFDRVARLLNTLDTELGGTLSAFEVLWNDFYRLQIGDGQRHGMPLPADSPFYVLLEATGSHPERDQARFEETLESALTHELISDAVIAQSQQQREELWGIRDDIPALFDSLGEPITFDISLPIQHMDHYVQDVRTRLEQRFPGARCIFFGHIGDGNVHPIISIGAADDAAVNAVEAIVYGSLQPFQGVISAEHGIGLSKRAWLPISRSPEEIALMRTLKQALDPRNLLNPHRVLAAGAD